MPNQVLFKSAVPTDAGSYYQAGDFVYNSAPSPGQPIGWVCIVAGYPGTWIALGAAQNPSVTTTQITGALTTGARLVLLNPASGWSGSLPSAALSTAGGATTIKNMAAVSVTLAPIAGEAYVDAAAITLAQFGAVTLISNGTTNWYKQA